MASIQKRASKDGKFRYRVQVRRKGQPPLTATFARKTDAQNWAEDRETEFQQKRHFKYAEAKKHTVGEAIDRYIETVLPRKPKSAYIQAPQLIRWRDEIGDIKLADLIPPLIVACRDRLTEDIVPGGKKRSLGTVNRYLAALSHVFTVAMKEWGWIDSNPVLAVAKFKEPTGRTRYLSDEERSLLLKACKNSKNLHLFPIVVIAIATGMRKQEILSLTWDNIDLERRIAYIFETKNSEPRGVPLANLALKLLRKFRQHRSNASNYVFPSLNGDRPIDIRSAWEVARNRSGLKGFRFHDLRHTTGSYLAMNGAS
ncbi:hypothetical protein LCGC14_2911670, partial [marine sediment metagenome]